MEALVREHGVVRKIIKFIDIFLSTIAYYNWKPGAFTLVNTIFNPYDQKAPRIEAGRGNHTSFFITSDSLILADPIQFDLEWNGLPSFVCNVRLNQYRLKVIQFKSKYIRSDAVQAVPPFLKIKICSKENCTKSSMCDDWWLVCSPANRPGRHSSCSQGY